MRIVGGILATCLVAGCAVREANLKAFDNQTEPTRVMRQSIVGFVRNEYKDPYSIRDAEISNVLWTVGIDGNKNSPFLCLRDNAKNSFGAYTGRSSAIIYFNQDGSVSRRSTGTFGTCDDTRLRYQPFPELEMIGAR